VTDFLDIVKRVSDDTADDDTQTTRRSSAPRLLMLMRIPEAIRWNSYGISDMETPGPLVFFSPDYRIPHMPLADRCVLGTRWQFGIGADEYAGPGDGNAG
jgi:hypothetical protein